MIATSSHKDIIIAGAGCAGLSLVMRMIRTGKFHNKTILLIDKDDKQANDRTWCFWEKDPGFFEDIVYHQWPALDFYSTGFHRQLNIEPYLYKMIRGKDFYDYCFAEIRKHSNISFLQAEISGFLKGGRGVLIKKNDIVEEITSDLLFNSLLRPSGKSKDIVLLQHFKGWVIRSTDDMFSPDRGTLMDFRISQEHGTSFVYVLPFNPREALVEYTLFTPSLLPDEGYDEGLRTYLAEFLNLKDYAILEKEFGVIPMTNHRFQFIEDGVYNIGTAGGQTKASSGYTFQFIQKQTAKIVDALVAGNFPGSVKPTAARFSFYDNTLLHILYHDRLPGASVFTDLFRKNNGSQVLKFLDNETSIGEELKIISTLPTWPFMQAALRQL